MTMIKDGQGRGIDYLRVSLTDKCNNRCIYCMPEEGIELMHSDKILTYEEIIRICTVGATLGMKKIKLTGGEPLVRKDVHVLIKALKAIPGIEKVTLTTNGVLLKKQLSHLVEAGLDGINVSLDTLDRAEYKRITRREGLQEVVEGIESAAKYPGLTVKINCVPVTTQTSDFARLVELARTQPVHIRFIEVMPIGYGKDLPFRSQKEVKAVLENTYGKMSPYHKPLGEGPCEYYDLPGFEGKIGFISAISHKFCATCNRVRLTAEGYFKTCLQYEKGVDLKSIIRQGESDETLTKAIEEAIYHKPESHHFHETKIDQEEQRSMSQIGG
ncbi:MAG: GTP 3',8-cyclase MoaA [Niameybacter sp.]|uniref:GTP 3',8-cyclase MoaA n=1 Tax=Niameybacter sp. TaxID=2033640 RepID=UPI002FC851A4